MAARRLALGQTSQCGKLGEILSAARVWKHLVGVAVQELEQRCARPEIQERLRWRGERLPG